MPSATASALPRTTQMNTRIDTALKKCGDAALASAGYSPSQAVRVLWAFAARNAQSPSAVADMLATLDATDDEKRDRRTQKLRAARQGRDLYGAFLASCGLEPPGPGFWEEQAQSEDDALEEAIAQRYEERGLL